MHRGILRYIIVMYEFYETGLIPAFVSVMSVSSV